MIIQACLNGARPALPLSAEALAEDAARVSAGAAELHVHPRDEAGRETLPPAVIDRAVLALRHACPGP